MPRNDAKLPTRRPARRSAAQRAAAAPVRSPDPLPAAAVLRQFRELFRVSQQHFQRIESHCGVSGAQLWALSELSSAPGLSVSQLARRMSIHLSTSSNLLDKLETHGFVRRERGTDDQRIVRVYVTASGQRLLKKAPRPAEGVIPDALAKMPAQALQSLQRDLGLLLDLACVRSPGAALKPLAEP
jgi:DNA-binding MarR family transcriptional regulator